MIGAKGEDNPAAKLTEEQVREMRRLRQEDPRMWGYNGLAERFKVSYRCAYEAVLGRNWSHVKE
jgi:hypothetical protein